MPRSEERSCYDNKEPFDPFHLENLKQESQTTIRPSWVIKKESRSTKALRSVIVEAANALALNSALVSVQHVSCLILESLSPNALHKQSGASPR